MEHDFSEVTLDMAREMFEHAPSAYNAGRYLSVAMTYESDEAISSETLLDVVATVRDSLLAMPRSATAGY